MQRHYLHIMRKMCCSTYSTVILLPLLLNVSVKQSQYRPGQVLRFPGGCQPYTPAAFTLQEIFLVLISVRFWVNLRVIMSMKISSDTIGNRTRDLPAGSAVPQPTAPPRAPIIIIIIIIIIFISRVLIVVYSLRGSFWFTVCYMEVSLQSKAEILKLYSVIW